MRECSPLASPSFVFRLRLPRDVVAVRKLQGGENAQPHRDGEFQPHPCPPTCAKTIRASGPNKQNEPLVPLHRHPTHLPSLPAQDLLHNAHLPPQHLVLHRRNLPVPAHLRALGAHVHPQLHPRRHPPAAQRSAPGEPAERGRCRPAEGGRSAGLGEPGQVLDGPGKVGRA
ncbi:ubiquitin-conjugating enzyme E2 2 [Coccidioides immitis RMSCC 3703]|uniref:Ubiquitin-conjugating enzyme E2 2 n=1 Tax=Coccidioides immitis RMSCC 3703 TaxID=454286 RepID=A0A0J8U4P4_COCIT|nr:ubiquitin-conjugating enzyme E2 2 [Coccidioides immitis RMSCC 3703]